MIGQIDEREGARQTSQKVAQAFTALDFLGGLIAASIHSKVFQGEAAFKYLFEQKLQQPTTTALGSLLATFDAELESTDLDTILRRTYHKWLSDRSSGCHEDEISIEANEMAFEIGQCMQEHITSETEPVDCAVYDWQSALSKPVLHAFELRCEISCAPERYSFKWPQQCSTFDDHWMEARDGGGGNVDVGVLFPALILNMHDCQEEVIAKAAVKAV